jgi:hypothetical protein
MKYKIITFLLTLLSFSLQATIIITNGLTHVHKMDKGMVVNGKIRISNDSKKSARVLIYKQDFIPNCNVSQEYLGGKNHAQSLNDWLTTNVNEKEMGPMEEYVVHYEIKIPEDNTKDGTFWSLVMVEATDPVKEENQNGLVVQSTMRYGVQIIADLGTYSSPEMNFEEVNVTNFEVEPNVLKVKLKNSGAFYSPTKLSFEILNSDGEVIKIVESITKKIYPGFCNDYEFQLIDFPKGTFDGILVADNGKDLFGTNLSIEIR